MTTSNAFNWYVTHLMGLEPKTSLSTLLLHEEALVDLVLNGKGKLAMNSSTKRILCFQQCYRQHFTKTHGGYQQ